jgi:hypothetical protein
LKVAIIEALAWIGKPLSATDLNKVLDNRFGLGNVAYHLGELAKTGAVKRTRSRQVRGAVEKFYGLSRRMLAPSSARTKSA